MCNGNGRWVTSCVGVSHRVSISHGLPLIMPIRNAHRDTQFARRTRGTVSGDTADIQLEERGLVPPSPAVAPAPRESEPAENCPDPLRRRIKLRRTLLRAQWGMIFSERSASYRLTYIAPLSIFQLSRDTPSRRFIHVPACTYKCSRRSLVRILITSPNDLWKYLACCSV